MNDVATPIKRNRSLAADTRQVLAIARQIPNGRLELEPILVWTGKHPHQERIRAMLMHDGDGVALQGVGKNATEAVHELLDVIEAMVASHQT